MSNMSSYNVFIEGDKSQFVSKSAVDNFRKTVKTTYNTDKFDLISLSKYLKQGYKFDMTVSENNLRFNIVVNENKPPEKSMKEIKL